MVFSAATSATFTSAVLKRATLYASPAVAAVRQCSPATIEKVPVLKAPSMAAIKSYPPKAFAVMRSNVPKGF